MKKMYICWIILIFGFVATLYYIGMTYSKSVEKYHVLEEDIKESATFYMDVNDISLGVRESIKISKKSLIDSKSIKDMKIGDEECDGYVKIKRTLSDYVIEPYIKCKNYQTEGY